jgi:D-glycero-D-manno-heptose 1,7-bisphosphate phosphatase
MKTGIFFERDGILTVARVERQHQATPLSLEDFKIDPAALPALSKLKEAGFVLIATTNQPGISRGTLSRRDLDRMHDLLRRSFPLDDIMVCPHDETDQCPCRKPAPGLFTEAAFKWHLDLERSFVVSDKWQDARAARTVGCTSMIIHSPWMGPGHHDFVLPNLSAVPDKILQLRTGHLAA